MTEPERALAQAREALESMRAAGAYDPVQCRAAAGANEGVAAEKLLAWALIEPDPRSVRSTRRLGAPITALKRLVLRLLRQYHAELLAQQTRFNVNLLAYARRLEDRVEALEHRLEDRVEALERRLEDRVEAPEHRPARAEREP